MVEEQGDGLRSYIGVLLELLAERHVFVVLDEPEAFLHPPQARQLATAIMETKQPHAQLFLATHDSNFVRGLLDTQNVQLSIIRIERNGDKNPVQVIEPATIKAVATDPILRHSSILDALFHAGAVICEAEPDCLLYESVLLDNNLIPPGTTLYFVGSSGKERVQQTCNLLRSLGVPASAIVDFDILKKREDVEGLLQALGFEAAELQSKLNSVVAQLSDLAKTKAFTKKGFLDRVSDILSATPDSGPLTTTKLHEIAALSRHSAEWGALKKHGVAEASGNVYAAVMDLLEELGSRRLHVVPVGELEGWFRSAPGKGGTHVAEVLRQGMHVDPEKGRDICKFARKVVNSLA